MKHPPYHLRSNKAVDRYLFVEALKCIIEHSGKNPRDYTYVGFGGPFLEDFKIVEHYFPDIKLVSLEVDADTVKRQKFHRFCRHVKLLQKTDSDFIQSLQEGVQVALWFDYVGRTPENIGAFSEAVRKADEWSILRITLNASQPVDQNLATFINDFEKLLPAEYEPYFANQENFGILLQKIIQSATTPLPGDTMQFRIVNSSAYKDGARMITITGVKCGNEQWEKLERRLNKWPFFTKNWDTAPEKINLPDLSLHERLHLAKSLPVTRGDPAQMLRRKLGYSVGGAESLANYAAFCRYFPIFSKLSV